MQQNRNAACKEYLDRIAKKAHAAKLRKQQLERTMNTANYVVLFCSAIAGVISVYDLFSSDTTPAQYTYIALTFVSTLVAGGKEIYGYTRRIHQHAVLTSGYTNLKSILDIILSREEGKDYSLSAYNVITAFANVLGLLEVTTGDSQELMRYPTGAIMMKGALRELNCNDDVFSVLKYHSLTREIFPRAHKVHAIANAAVTQVLYCNDNTTYIDLSTVTELAEWFRQFKEEERIYVYFSKFMHDGAHYLIEAHKVFDVESLEFRGYNIGILQVPDAEFAAFNPAGLQYNYAQVNDQLELDDLNPSVV